MSPHGAPGATHFGRMFGDLEPCALGEEDAIALAGALTKQEESEGNPEIAAGYTYLAQFIDHDLTFNATNLPKGHLPATPIDAGSVPNLRTARFDLDSLYGTGPDDQPFLYVWDTAFRKDRGSKFIIGGGDGGSGLAHLDLQRNREGRAIIGDPRNDENQILSQLHLLLQRFHNQVVDFFDREDLRGRALFEAARTHVTLHYQHLVLHDFLPRITGKSVKQLLADRPLKKRMPADGAMPVEFSGAAYRFGHSMVREDYRLRGNSSQPVPIFAEGRDDLRGGRRLTDDKSIFWSTFFQPPVFQESVQASMRIDHKLAPPLQTVPDRGSLAELNLRRGIRLGLPSGQAVAEVLGVKALGSKLWGKADDVVGLENEKLRDRIAKDTPLWFYILREAAVEADGLHLGPVGAAIVAEVVLSLLERTPGSIYDPATTFTPDLWPGDKAAGEGTGGEWTMFLQQAYVHYGANWDWFFSDNEFWKD